MRRRIVSTLVLCACTSLLAASGPWDNPPALPAPANTIVNVAAGNAADLVSKVRNAASNTTILIPVGTYQLSDNTGPMRIGANSAVTNVTLRGATGNRNDVVIRGPGMSVDSSATVPHCLMIENAKDILVANLSIGEVWYHPITIQGPSGADRVHVYNCRLFNAGEQFLKSNPLNSDGTPDSNGYSGASDGIVEYCVFEFTNTARWWYTEGIDVHAGHRWIVRNNLFQNIRGPAGADLVGGAIDFWNRSSDTLVENNTVFNCEVGIRLGVLDRDGYNDHSGGIVRNNFVYRAVGSTNNSDVGIIVNDSPNTQVLHNTVLLNGTYPNTIEIRFSTANNGRVSNNLCDGDVSLRDGAAATLSGNRTNATSALFVNAANADLHLVASAANVIDQVAVEANCVTDWDGQGRPAGMKADIGADEFAATAPPPPALPAAPTSLNAAALAPNQIQLTWIDTANNETGFKLERRTGSGAYSQIATPTTNATSYTDSNCTPSTQYFYRLRATNSAGDSSYSNEAQATTPSISAPPIVPNAPSNLIAVGASDSRMALAWSDNSNNESGFELQRSADNVTFSPLGMLAANTTAYNDDNLPAATTFYYRVRAVGAGTQSAFSNVAAGITMSSGGGGGGSPPGQGPNDDYDGDGFINSLDSDDDNDGVSDTDEIAAGTNPFDPASAPPISMTIKSLAASLNFKLSGKDRCALNGVLPALPPGFDPNGKILVLNIGGASVTWTLNAKAAAKTDAGSIALRLKPSVRNKVTKHLDFLGGDILFKATLRNGTWSDDWMDEGVNAVQDATKTPMAMSVTINIDGKKYAAAVNTLYSARSGKSGRVKSTK